MSMQDGVLSEMPIGWSVLPGNPTAPNGYVWISNNKDIWEKEIALLKIKEFDGDL